MSKPKEYSELVVITRAKELSAYIFVICETAPKKFRQSLITRMQNLSLDIISKLYEANEMYINMSLIKDIDKTIEGLNKTQPRSQDERFHMQNKLLQLKLTKATKIDERVNKRLDASYRAMTLLKELDHVGVVAQQMNCITYDQHKKFAEHIYNVQNLIGAFIRSDRKRFNY